MKLIDFWTTAHDTPAVSGTYVLVIDLSEPVAVSICGKPSALLAPGRYLYCGSAKGPGGLRARLARHMRHGKPIHWHIDRLTEAGTVLGAWTFCAPTNVIWSPPFRTYRSRSMALEVPIAAVVPAICCDGRTASGP